MEFPDINKFSDQSLLQAGKVLIAQPFMADASFSRTVVLLCEYGDEGALGFILNQPTSVGLSDVLPDFPETGLLLNQGGPVQLDTLHILHNIPDVFEGTEVLNSVYWGGSLETLHDYIALNPQDENKLKLFVGYSGWSPGQLENELKEGAWLIADVPGQLIFNTSHTEIWKESILTLGEEYRFLTGMPIDPNLN